MPDKFSKDVGQILREYRERLNVSQYDLADRADINKNSVGMYERGERVPGLEMVLTLSDALQVPAGELVATIQARVKAKKSIRRH